MKLSAVVLMIAGLQGCRTSEPLTVLISGYNRKLNVFNVTGSGHVVEKLSELEVDGSLSWLEVEDDILYAIHEDSNLVSRWRLASDLMSLERLERVRIPSSGPAHLAVVKPLVTISRGRSGRSFKLLIIRGRCSSLTMVGAAGASSAWRRTGGWGR